jgi:threonine/homoserine efflux transporter RhtA
MLALLPATAILSGAIVLAQVPNGRDVIGVLLVVLGVAPHGPAAHFGRIRKTVGHEEAGPCDEIAGPV